MYKTLPNEDEAQRNSRLQKENRELKRRPLIETNPYITSELLKRSVESSTAVEGVHIELEIPKETRESNKKNQSFTIKEGHTEFRIPEKFEEGYPKIRVVEDKEFKKVSKFEKEKNSKKRGRPLKRR